MVGANYTGGRRNAAKARSKDTAARLQRGHFSKQRLGIITDALRSRRPDHQSLSRALPSAVADNPNLTSNHPSGSLISPSRYSTCTQVATVYDISFAHAKRHLAQNQPQPRQSTQQDLHLHRNDDPSPPQPERPRLDPSVRNHSPVVTSAESSTSLALTGKGEPDPTSSPQTSLLATASTTISSCATSPSPSRSIPQLSYHPEPAFRRAALPDKQPTPVTEVPSKRRPKILDLIDISNPASVRAQIDRILALPSLLGVTCCIDTPAPSLPADIASDNITSSRSDGEGCHVVNDLQLGHSLAAPPPMLRANHSPSANPIQIWNQMPVWQPTRRSPRPSDPPPAVINRTGLDRDRHHHHQPTPLAIQSYANSTDGDLLSSPELKCDRDGDGGNRQIAPSDPVVGNAPEIEACTLPRGQKRDFRCTPGWIWKRSSNPNSEGNAKPERRTDTNLNEDDTNMDGGVESNVNLGFGSKTVGPFSSSQVKSSISDWGEFGLLSPNLGDGSRTEVEIPPSKLAVVLSPPPLLFGEMGEGGSAHEDGACSAFQDHIRVPGPLRTPSRYPRSPPRSAVESSFLPHSHDFSSTGILVMDATDGVNVRIPDRRGVGDLREVSGEEQCVEFRFSPADVQQRIDGQQEKQRKYSEAGGVGTGVSDLDNLFPSSFPSGSGIKSCSPTAGSLSPQTEVLSDSGFPETYGDQDAACAFRRRLRSDGLNGMATRKVKKVYTGECGNYLGRVGSVDSCYPSRRLSAVSVDGPDDGGEESGWTGLGSVSGGVGWFARADAAQDRDVPSSRCSSLFRPPRSCADADVNSGSSSAVLPRSRCAGIVSYDRGSTFGSSFRRHAKGRAADNALSPGSRSCLRIPYQTPMSGSLRASPSLSTYTYDTRVFQDNNELNANKNTSLIHTYEHVHTGTQEFDTLRFSSSPSRSISGSAPLFVSAPTNLFLGGDDWDQDKGSEVGGSRPGIIELPLNGELRSYMKTDMKPDSNTSTGSDGGVDGALLDCNTLCCPMTSFINNRADYDDGSVLGHVDGIEHRDLGGLEHKIGPLDPRGRASPISVSVSGSGVSGVSAAGSLFPPVLGTRPYLDDEDIWSPTSLGSRTMSIQSRSIDCEDGEEEAEECGLLKSLLESSDPWGLMRKKVLNLPSPTPSEVERRGKRDMEDVVRVKGSLGRRGVGYVTPPSMDALLGMVGSSDEVGMKQVKEGGDADEDSQEILDFRSPQPHTYCDTLIQRERSDFGLPSPDLASTSTTIDVSSDPLGSPNPTPQFQPYRDANHEDDHPDSDPSSKSHSSLRSDLQSRQDHPRKMGQSTRKRSRRSSGSEGSEDVTFIDDELVRADARKRMVTLSTLGFGSGSSMFASKRLSPSLPENLRIGGVSANERTLRHHRKSALHDRWTGTPTISVPEGGNCDPCYAPGYAEMGNIPGADWFNARTRTKAGTGRLNAAVGVFRAWEPRTTTIDSLLGGFDGMEPLVAEPPVAEQRDDAGNQCCQVEEENGKDRKWDESLRHTRPSTNTASGRIASDSDDSTSISQSAGPIRNDRGEGISVGLDCEVEDCNLVPGHGNRDGKRVDLKPSPRRGDWRCGVDEFKLRRINEGGERERFDGFVLSAPTDPYTDFAFDLDRTAHDDPQRTSGPSVAAGLDHPSVSETLRPLESAIGLHTGAETTVDLAPMDVDTTFSGPISKGISSREGEAQGCGQLSDSLPSLLPFQFSTSKLPAPASSLSLLPPAVTAAYDLALMDLDLGSSLETPAEVRPRPTPRISATVFGSGLTLGSVGPASTLISPGPAAIREKVFVGPSLFLGDDGME